MKCQKITKLSHNASDAKSMLKFNTRKLVEVNDQSGGMYNTNKN